MAVSEHEEPVADEAAAARLREATETLEALARDRTLLRSSTSRSGRDCSPPRASLQPRRRHATALGQGEPPREKNARTQRDQAERAETGIRVLRAKPVFTTPNVFAPRGFEQVEARAATAGARGGRAAALLRLQAADYTELHHFYDQLCPPCGDFNFAKRTETADLRGRVALLTGGRVKIGYQAGHQAAARRRDAHRHDPLPARRRRALRRASRTSRDWGDRLEIFGLDLRHTPSVEAFCTHLLDDARPARLHRQQRLPDRAPAAGVLPPHARGRDGVGAGDARARARLLGEYEGLRGRPASSACTRRARSPSSARTPPSCRRCRCSRGPRGAATSSPRAGSTRTCSRSTCATGTPGGCCWPRCRRSSCSRRSSSTRSRPFVLNARLKPLMLRDARARQAHRQRVGGGGAVLPAVQDHAAPAHQHGQGRAQHDDAHLGGRLPRRRHPHEQRRHRLGDRRGPASRSPRARRRSTASTRRSTSSTAPPASSTRSSTAINTGHARVGAVPQGLPPDRLVADASGWRRGA